MENTLEAVSKGKTSEAIKKLMGIAQKTAIVISLSVSTNALRLKAFKLYKQI
ncbi:MAG TPA: hypothetical protein VIK44_01155 [Acetobacterium sp.]